MARALRSVSIARGCDPRDDLLVPFGGRGGATCLRAGGRIGHSPVALPCRCGAAQRGGHRVGRSRAASARPGVYRPYLRRGLGGNRDGVRAIGERSPRGTFGRGDGVGVGSRLGGLANRGRAAARFAVSRPGSRLDDRATLSMATTRRPIAAEHQRLYGFTHPDRALEIVAVRVEAIGRWSAPLPKSGRIAVHAAAARRFTTAWFGGHPQRTPVFRRDELPPGAVVRWPGDRVRSRLDHGDRSGMEGGSVARRRVARRSRCGARASAGSR